MLLKIRKTVSILRSFVSFAVALSACLAADGKEDVIAHWTGDGKRKWGKEKQGKWLEDGRIYDNWGFNGCDGIIYADMVPKEQFWRVKAAYRDMTPAP